MISKPTTVDQIDAWRKADSETETLEFKEAKNHFDYDKLLKYCVALANERGGRLLLGIKDKPPRPVVGTAAFLSPTKTANELFNRLGFRVDIEEVAHPDGRILLFHVPSRPVGHAYELDGSYWMRSGESLVAMTMDQLKQIIAEGELSEPPKTSIYLKAAIYIVTVFLLIVITVAIWRAAQRSGTNERLSTGDNVTAILRTDWHDKHNWRDHLHVGMPKAQVEQLFGAAERIDVAENLEEWGYGSGQITFWDGKIYSWYEPDSEKTLVKPGTDSKSHGNTEKQKPTLTSPVQAPYGNLAKRCQDLGTGILLFVKQRNETKPDARSHFQEYLDWFTRNDGQFRFHFDGDAKALQKDLAAVNIKDRRLDELIARYEQYYVERNRVPAETVFANAPMYYLSIEDIEEIGQRFKYLVTQIPSS